MKTILTITLFAVVLNIFSQKNTIVYIENPQQKKLVFLDYLTYDSIFSTTNIKDSFLVKNDNYTKTIILDDLAINTTFNIVILEADTIKINCSEYLFLKFENSKTNNDYQFFKRKLNSLKKNNSIDSLINSHIYIYMLNHSDLLISLEYAYNSLLYKLHSKESVIKLLNNIDEKYKNNNLWHKCLNLLEDIKELKDGDFLPSYQVNNEKFETLYFNKIDSKTNSLIVFWASWCKACKTEINLIKTDIDYFKKYNISLINLEDKKTWLRNIQLYNYSQFDNYNLTGGIENLMAREIGVKSLPHNLMIESNNQILKTKVELYKIDSFQIVLYYKNGAFILTDNQKALLDRKIDSIKIKKISRIRINGYASKIGDKNENLELSNKRCDNIKNYLLNTKNKLDNKIKTHAIGELYSSKNDQKRDRKTIITIKYFRIDKNIMEFNDLINIEIGEKFVMKKLLFFGNKEYVMDKSFNELRRLKGFLTLNTDVKIKILGHIDLPKDWKGGDYTNLSSRRAEYVYNYLIKSGINKERLDFEGLGGDFPLFPHDSNKSYLNRRVELLRVE